MSVQAMLSRAMNDREFSKFSSSLPLFLLFIPSSCVVHSNAQDVFNETRSILEPAGAVGVAGAKAWLKHNKYKVSPSS